MLDLYNACDCFVFPSFYEGFGLPILEAMACGRAVACSNTSAMPEVADGAGLLFDPHSVDEIERAMSDILLDSELRAPQGTSGIAARGVVQLAEERARHAGCLQGSGGRTPRREKLAPALSLWLETHANNELASSAADRSADALPGAAAQPSALTGFPFTDESLNYSINWPSGLSLGEAHLHGEAGGYGLELSSCQRWTPASRDSR